MPTAPIGPKPDINGPKTFIGPKFLSIGPKADFVAWDDSAGPKTP